MSSNGRPEPPPVEGPQDYSLAHEPRDAEITVNGDGRRELRQRLVPIRWGELQLLPKREPLLEGVFDLGAMSALVGASGAYKTGVAIDWVGHIGTGMAWRGHRVRKGVPVYIAVEGGRGIAERFEAWRKHHRVSAEDGEVYVIPEPIDLAHGEADTKLLLQRIAGIGRVDFIVADTLSRALAGGDENSSKDMGAFVRNCDLIRSETNAHLCVLHHLGKDEARGARGHSLLKAALDTELTASKTGRIGTLELTKQRDGLDGTRWGFAIQPVNLSDGKCSFVVVPADMIMPKTSRWARGLSVFRDAVTAAILAEGQDHRPGGNGPIVKAVAVECIRTEHNRLYVHGGDGDRAEAERKAWTRALKSARDNRLIGSENSCGRDFVWLVS
jgi:AAA domain